MATKKTEDAKPKRTVLSPTEKLAKMEADLAAQREKVAAQVHKAGERVASELTKVNQKIADLEAKRQSLKAKLDEIGYVPAPAEPVTEGTED